MTHYDSNEPPYYMLMHVNGVKTLTDNHIREVYREAVNGDVLSAVMLGQPMTEDAFLHFVKSPENCFAVVYDSEIKPVAFYWMNNFSGRCAAIHFCVLRHAFSQSFDIGKYVCHWILDTGYVDTLIGITPKVYRAAIKFVKRLGFVEKAAIPKAFELNGRYIDGILTIKTKEVVHG